MTPKQTNEVELPIHEEVPPPSGFDGVGRKSAFPESLIIVARHKRLVAYTVASVAVLTVVISLLLPQYYTSETKILPPQQNQSIATAMLGQLGQLAPLLGAAKDLGIHNPNEMYIAMLRSRTVADHLIQRFSLMTVYKEKRLEDTRRRLGSLTEIDSAKSGIITVAVQDRDPARATDMANAYIDELENLTKTLAITEASKRRIFFEREVKAASDELAAAEVDLRQTQERTGLIEPSSQAKVLLEGYSELRAAVTAKEIEIQSMRSFATPDNPDLVRAQNELAALRDQIARFERGPGGRPISDIGLEKVPAKSMEFLRKYREVRYHETLFELLAKQYEIARLDEAKDMPVIQALDKAVRPERRSFPKRGAIVLVSTVLATIAASALALLIEKTQKAREDPQFLAQVHLFLDYLRH